MTVSVMLLYSTRKRDSVVEEFESIQNQTEHNDAIGSDDDSSTLQQSLLRPQPPEEAFRAFHSFRHGEDDANDSFSLGSPVPRNNVGGTDVEEQATILETDNAPDSNHQSTP